MRRFHSKKIVLLESSLVPKMNHRERILNTFASKMKSDFQTVLDFISKETRIDFENSTVDNFDIEYAQNEGSTKREIALYVQFNSVVSSLPKEGTLTYLNEEFEFKIWNRKLEIKPT